MEIKDEITAQATECEKGLGCIKNADHHICKVETFINDKVIFVKCLDDKYCSYKLAFGSFFVCTCPVRREIFNKYRK